MVSSPFKGHSREMLRGASHPRSFSHRGENEQGTGRSPCRRIAPYSERGRCDRAEEVALAAAQTRRESEDGTALPVARSGPLQPEDRALTFLRKPFSSSGITTRPHGPESSSMTG